MKEILPEEDKHIAFEFIIYNLLITALDKDIDSIKQSNLKLKTQHVAFLEKVRDQVIKDSSANKKLMNQRGIKVFEHTKVKDDFWSYKYLVRGYEGEFRPFTSALKMHTEKKLAYYYSIFASSL